MWRISDPEALALVAAVIVMVALAALVMVL
jgi:hypothetical protein